MNFFRWVNAGLFALLLGAAGAHAQRRDIDHERLSRSLAQLEADAKLAPYAASEIAAARAALVVLLEDSRGKKREHALYIAERRVDIAYAAAQVADFSDRERELKRERDRLLLAAARYEADQARRELERQRMLAQIRAEEMERAALNAEQARVLGEQDTAAARLEAEQSMRVAAAQARESELARQEAQLAGASAQALRARLETLQATRGASGMQMSLGDVAFGSGQSALRAEAGGAVDNLVDFVNRNPGQPIRIEGHTDSTGSDPANVSLSQRRADAVGDALVAAGVEAGRITAIGMGSANPVDSNETADGRARNRRVDVIIEDKQ
ncbi:MAG: OmpA family protein [Dokdonella sp.]